MDPKDRDDLKTLLRALSILPSPLLRMVLGLCRTRWTPTLRMIELGLKGLTMSLYYSNKTAPHYSGRKPFDVLGFSLQRLKSHPVCAIHCLSLCSPRLSAVPL